MLRKAVNWSQRRQFPEEKVCTRNFQESTLSLHTLRVHVREEVTMCLFLLLPQITPLLQQICMQHLIRAKQTLGYYCLTIILLVKMRMLKLHLCQVSTHLLNALNQTPSLGMFIRLTHILLHPEPT